MAIYITNEEMHAIYDHVLDDLCINHREEIVEDPEKDFTRKTRMTLDRVITLTVACSSEGLKPNMLDFKAQTGIWGDLVMPPYISTFTESRKKAKPEGFERVFSGVTAGIMNYATWEKDPGCDYHLSLCAVDGTSLPYDSSGKYSDDKYSARGTKAWCQECTVIDDLEHQIFTDAMVHGVKGKGTGEPSDFVTMVDRAEIRDGIKVLYIGDIAYGTANAMAHVQEKGQFFLFRTKDIDSNGFISSLRLPEGAFDIDLEVRIGWAVPHLWEPDDTHRNHCLGATTRFDYIERGSWKTYTLHLRVMRQKIEDTWYVLLANLPRKIYSTQDVLRYYNKRWGEEVDFRDWKYTIGTLSFHARLDKLITQEIWAKLLLFNMCSAVAASAPRVALDTAGTQIPKRLRIFQEKGPDRIAVDFVEAVHAIRLDFLARNKTPMQIAAEITQYKERIRPGRHESHTIRPRRRFYLNYRSA